MCLYLSLSALHISDSLVYHPEQCFGAVHRNWYKPVPYGWLLFDYKFAQPQNPLLPDIYYMLSIDPFLELQSGYFSRDFKHPQSFLFYGEAIPRLSTIMSTLPEALQYLEIFVDYFWVI